MADSPSPGQQTGSISKLQNFYATAVPQVYSYLLRPISGQTSVSLALDPNASFVNMTTDAPYRVGSLILTYYKLTREPINKFALAKRTYQYLTLDSNTSIRREDGVSAKITFVVDSAWVASAGASVQQIALYVFDLQNNLWQKLDTTYMYQAGGQYRFVATTNLFGYFAIAIDRPLQGTGDIVVGAPPSSAGSANMPSTPSTVSQPSDARNSVNAANASAVSTTPTPSGAQPLSNTPGAPVNVDAIDPNAQLEVVYPLLDQKKNSLPSWQVLVGYGLLAFALCGTAFIGTTIVHRQKKNAKNNTPPVQQSVNDILHRLQATRTQKLHTAQSTTGRVDVNALLARVNERYSAGHAGHNGSPVGEMLGSMSDPHRPVITGTSTAPSGSTHQDAGYVDQLKETVTQLEPNIVRRYAIAGLRQGKSAMQIKQELLANDIDESIIDRVLLMM